MIDPARKAALERYARAHDNFAEAEQVFTGRGQHLLAKGAHEFGLIALRAWLADKDDKDPLEVPHG